MVTKHFDNLNPSGEGWWRDQVSHRRLQHRVRVLRVWQGGEQEEAEDCSDGKYQNLVKPNNSNLYCVQFACLSFQFVLPPFQRMGLGARLLDSIYSHYKGDSTVVDITVEVWYFPDLGTWVIIFSRTHLTTSSDWETSLTPKIVSNWLPSRKTRCK